MMQQMANVERDEDCSIVVGSESDLAGRDRVRVTDLPIEPPCYHEGTEYFGEGKTPTHVSS
jgi:hypothetical protein